MHILPIADVDIHADAGITKAARPRKRVAEVAQVEVSEGAADERVDVMRNNHIDENRE